MHLLINGLTVLLTLFISTCAPGGKIKSKINSPLENQIKKLFIILQGVDETTIILKSTGFHLDSVLSQNGIQSDMFVEKELSLEANEPASSIDSFSPDAVLFVRFDSGQYAAKGFERVFFDAVILDKELKRNFWSAEIHVVFPWGGRSTESQNSAGYVLSQKICTQLHSDGLITLVNYEN